MKNIHTSFDLADSRSDMTIAALAVSRGFALGTAVCLHGKKRQFFRVEIPRDQVEMETARFAQAVQASRKQLETLSASGNGFSESASGIFDVHLMILDHSPLALEVEEMIASECVNAEWALKTVSEKHSSNQNSAPDAHFRDRAVDLQDVTDRLMSALGGTDDSIPHLADGSVVVATMMKPSTLMELSRHRPVAIITEHGGWTSHAFIMARELKIPAVTGIRNVMRRIADGDPIAVDGFQGRVIIRPGSETLDRFKDSFSGVPVSSADADATCENARTLDGREIVIRANAEHLDSSSTLERIGAKGLGLVRSEYLFGRRAAGFPSEDEQFEAYSLLARTAGVGGIRVRTFDLSADQITFSAENRELNPALGLRGIRLSLAYQSRFRDQIRAILRAAAHGNVSIVLPMVSGISEIERANALIAHEIGDLINAGIDIGNPRLGVMIELPSAVLTINEIIKAVDFICLGTNDLVQYLLGVDRDNELVAELYETLHPAVVSSISTVLRAAEFADVPAAVCGEMAGSPFYTPLLIGLGAREFSMNIDSIKSIRGVVAGISFEEGSELARAASELSTASETEKFLRSYYAEKWPHLFTSQFLQLDHAKNLAARS